MKNRNWLPFASIWVHPRFFGGVCVVNLLGFSVLCCVVFSFVCLCPVSCVPNVASVSRLFLLDRLFGFLQLLFIEKYNLTPFKVWINY
jgi:hypothetical protein